MFVMPIVLVVVITSVQNSSFEMVNDNKLTMLLVNNDTGAASKEFVSNIEKLGMFNIIRNKTPIEDFSKAIKEYDALVALVIPENFSKQLNQKVKTVTGKALANFGLPGDTLQQDISVDSLELIFHPVLQQSYRYSINGGLQSVLQVVENKMMIQSLYSSINEKEMPEGFENDLMGNKIGFKEKFAVINGSRSIPNATQHNVPAWTIFAMFFIVISLGGNMVKEKLSGSFIRLKTLPTNYFTGLFAKQIIYLGVVLLQVLVIFSIGVFVFPKMNLPALNIPHDIFGLALITIMSGWCAISYAMMIGVFANTQEQANGFGAISVVLFAAIGGIFVPSFAMPQSFRFLLNLSPLHWCLESYYGLFLQGGNLKDIIPNILPLFTSALIFQALILIELKRKNLF
jgi:ABC-2 type transport system permease protein